MKALIGIEDIYEKDGKYWVRLRVEKPTKDFEFTTGDILAVRTDGDKAYVNDAFDNSPPIRRH